MAPLIVLVVRAVSGRLRASSREVQQAMGYITQVIDEAIGGHRVVKLFGGQDYEKRRFDEEANRVRRHVMKQISAAAASTPIVQLIAAVALAVIIYIATLQSSAAQLSVGEFAAFITGMLLLTAPLKRITDVNEHLQKGLAAAESIFGLIDEPRGAGPGHARDRPRARRDPLREREPSPTATRRGRRSTRSTSRSRRARRWRWSGLRAPARPRSRTWCRASITPPAGACCSTATTSRRSRSRACAPTSRW